MTRLKLRTALLFFVAMAGVNVLLFGGLAFWQDQQQSQVTDRLVGDVRLARAAGQADMMHDALRGTAYRALLAGAQAPEAEKQAVQAEIEEYTKSFDKALEEVQQGSTSPNLQQAVADALPVVQRYTRLAAQLAQNARSGSADTSARRATFLADFKLLGEKLDHLGALVEKRAEQTLVEREHTQQRVHLATAVAVALSLAVLLAYGFALAKILMRQLGAEPPHLRQFANRIAQGQLAAKLHGAEAVPSGSVAAAMMSMQNALCEAVASIRESSDSVATGSEQIASGNQELSSRTERQASRLQATAASMEELSGSVKQTAGHARLASELADAASRVAQLGGESVQRVEQTMTALQASSNRIADITGVIDSIAFQTNILALNAAVEAARAGEQGRGFAVVANEVRGLAQRSANAAREIKSLIQASTADVDAGNQTVAEAGRTMRDIQAGVLRVTELIGQIHTASSQQDSGIGQVAVSVADLDRDTQGNAALVEETAAASQSLSEQAQRLAQAVASFQLQAV